MYRRISITLALALLLAGSLAPAAGTTRPTGPTEPHKDLPSFALWDWLLDLLPGPGPGDPTESNSNNASETPDVRPGADPDGLAVRPGADPNGLNNPPIRPVRH